MNYLGSLTSSRNKNGIQTFVRQYQNRSDCHCYLWLPIEGAFFPLGKTGGESYFGEGSNRDVALSVGEGKIRMDSSERKRDDLRAERAPQRQPYIVFVAVVARYQSSERHVSLWMEKNTRCKINLEIREKYIVAYIRYIAIWKNVACIKNAKKFVITSSRR